MIRLIDLIVSAIGIVLTAPLTALGALGTKLSSQGPVLYRATRAGIGGTPFTMLKLRTMHVGSDSSGPITGSADARVFRWGHLLRRLKLDELPQLLNVLRGEMSLVGPRPEDIDIVHSHYTPFMRGTLTVHPGITGPGSLDYFVDEDSLPADPVEAEAMYLYDRLPRKIALDLVYVRNRTVRYHLELVLRTLLGVVGFRSIFATRMQWELDTAMRYLAEETQTAS